MTNSTAIDERPRQIPAVGEAAPAVDLPDETGTVHHLKNQHGRWTILYFYPEDDTSGCTKEACQFRDLHDQIQASDADVWGVSPDPADSHERFKTKYGLPFTLLSDVDMTVINRYGAWGVKDNYGKKYMGLIRSSFLIDPDGKIVKVWPKVIADGHAAKVTEALAAAKSQRAASADRSGRG
jgi:peroxiredoxin Q/BCP